MSSPDPSDIFSPSSEGTNTFSVDEKKLSTGPSGFSTLEVVPASNLEHYRRLSEVQRSLYPPPWGATEQGVNDEATNPSPSVAYPPPSAATYAPPSAATYAPPSAGGSNNPYPNVGTNPFTTTSVSAGHNAPGSSAPSLNGKAAPITICGMPRKAFWIVFGTIAALLALGGIIGGAVGGTRHEAVRAVTAVVTVTYLPSSTISVASITAAANATTTTASVCVGGDGNGNYGGLCSYACSYGYCPSGPCTCTSSGAPVATPSIKGIVGIPLSTEDDSYLGLCSFCCNHGYCPSSACTTSAAS